MTKGRSDGWTREMRGRVGDAYVIYRRGRFSSGLGGGGGGYEGKESFISSRVSGGEGRGGRKGRPTWNGKKVRHSSRR